MKALILVGGYGTRLRPLTLSYPKPVVEFCNKPLLVHQIEALLKQYIGLDKEPSTRAGAVLLDKSPIHLAYKIRRLGNMKTELPEVGVTEVILAVSRCADKSDTLESELKKYQLGVRILFSYEDEAMGTAGPIALARSSLLTNPSPFFVLNSDIMCEFPFKEVLNFHNAHGHEATIVVTQVDEPSKYGVVVHDAHTGLVECFIEKPIEFRGDRINAGIYLLNPSIIDKIPLRPTSIEKEIFPSLAEAKQLYCISLKGQSLSHISLRRTAVDVGFWMDVGQPQDFLVGTQLYLNYLKSSDSTILAKGPNIRSDVLIHPTAKVSPSSILGPSVVVGPHCVIEDGVRIRNSTLLQGSRIGSHSWISNCIVGWRSTIGHWVRMENTCVLGEDVVVSDELFVNGARVLPHKNINHSILDPQIIM